MKHPLKILHLEDEPEVVKVIQSILKSQNLDCEFQVAENREEYIKAITHNNFDLILADYALTGFDGLAALKIAQKICADTPFIILSGAIGEERAIELIKEGATDYILKSNMTRFVSAVTRALKESEENKKRKEIQEKLRKSELRFRSIVETAHDAIILTDGEGKIITWNKGAERIFGYVLDEKSNQWENLKNQSLKITRDVNSSVYSLEIKARRKNGQIFPAEISLSSWKNGETIFLCVILRDITDRKTAEANLRKSEKRYRTLVETMLDGVGIIDTTGIITYAKNELKKICLEIEKLKENQRSIYETQLITKTGEIRSILISASPYLDENNYAIGTINVLHDITERKQTEAALSKEKYLLDMLMNNITDNIYFKDRDGRFIRVNKAMARYFGFKDPSEMVGKTVFDFFADEYARQAYEDELEIMRKNRPIQKEEKEVWPDGRITWISTVKVPLYDLEGNIIGTLGISRDITEIKKREQEIRQAHKETEQILTSISSILIGIDSQDRIFRWNEAAEEVFGIPAKDVLGKPFLNCGIQWDWQEVLERIAECKETKKINRWEDIRYTRPDGKEGFLSITISPTSEDSNLKSGFLLLATEVTEKKIMQSQLNQAQKLEAIGQLAAGIAHEINTPTQFVSDNIHFLEDAFEDLSRLLEKYKELIQICEKVNDFRSTIDSVKNLINEIDLEYLKEEIPAALDQSKEGLNRIANIVRAMKEFSHPGTEEKVPVDINKAIENTLIVSKNEWKYVADVITELDENLPPVPCLPGELNQVFLNIIVNAAHAIKDVVSENASEKGKIIIKTWKEDDSVKISISDTGPGIPEEIRDKIFDPFFTTKEVGKGTGQGLAISYDVIVNKHGGSITFETELGKGTTFIISLPVEES